MGPRPQQAMSEPGGEGGEPVPAQPEGELTQAFDNKVREEGSLLLWETGSGKPHIDSRPVTQVGGRRGGSVQIAG